MKINLEFLKSLFFQNGLCCICKEENLKSGLICDSCLKNYERESRKFLFKNEFFIHYTGSYDENIKNALLRYKYGRESYLYKAFARIFKSYMEKNFMDFDVRGDGADSLQRSPFGCLETGCPGDDDGCLDCLDRCLWLGRDSGRGERRGVL